MQILHVVESKNEIMKQTIDRGQGSQSNCTCGGQYAAERMCPLASMRTYVVDHGSGDEAGSKQSHFSPIWATKTPAHVGEHVRCGAQGLRQQNRVGHELTKVLSRSFPHHSSTNSAYTLDTPGFASPTAVLTFAESCSLAIFRASTKGSPTRFGVRRRVADNFIVSGWEGSVSRRWACRWSRSDSRRGGGEGYADISS